MEETPSYEPLLTNPGPVVVVDSQFCILDQGNLTVSRKIPCVILGDFNFTDIKGNDMFRVKGKFLNFCERGLDGRQRESCRIYAAKGSRVFQMRAELNVFLAANPSESDCDSKARNADKSTSDSEAPNTSGSASDLKAADTSESAKAANTSERACDVKIKASFLESACTIYLGDSSTIVGQMKKNRTVKTAAGEGHICSDCLQRSTKPKPSSSLSASFLTRFIHKVHRQH